MADLIEKADGEISDRSQAEDVDSKAMELKNGDSSLEKLFDLMLDINGRLEHQEEELRRLRDVDELSEPESRRSIASRGSKGPKIHTVTRAAPVSRQNMSFTNQKAKEIEKENHRLLAEIQRKKQKPKVKKPPNRKAATTTSTSATQPARVTASLVNRRRDAQRIQFENLLLLKRLQKAKPTETIRKSTNVTRSRPTSANRNTNRQKKRSSSADARPSREGANADSNSRSSSAKSSKPTKPKSKPVWEAGW
ncbi:Cilia- and flagella-associated protein 97 [Trichoplax sp. H2]|nr:Cilia- and flagella-associated protein 97 [Trichoplax sp. H2]|eukprot:RDD42297.1 Cilia- and flagella-associated protein 97 [Trichoplax sp. H2]